MAISRTCGRRARAGFTLVELMVTLIIIGLISGVAVASWVKMLPNQQFNTAIRNLSEVLHETRSNAIARNHIFRIVYDLDNDRYHVYTPFRIGGGLASGDDDDERLFTHVTDLAESGIDLTEITVDDQVIDTGLCEVYFRPLGASSYHCVHLRQPQLEREYTLESLPLTGEIRLHEGNYKREPVDEGDFR